jgi:hypothetical protein
MSAKHGLLRSETVVGPYNETLGTRVGPIDSGGHNRFSGELRNVVHPGDTAVFLAGLKYRQFLESDLLALVVKYPFAMLEMRERLPLRQGCFTSIRKMSF